MGNHDRTVDKSPIRALYSSVSVTKRWAWTMTFVEFEQAFLKNLHQQSKKKKKITSSCQAFRKGEKMCF